MAPARSRGHDTCTHSETKPLQPVKGIFRCQAKGELYVGTFDLIIGSASLKQKHKTCLQNLKEWGCKVFDTLYKNQTLHKNQSLKAKTEFSWRSFRMFFVELKIKSFAQFSSLCFHFNLVNRDKQRNNKLQQLLIGLSFTPICSSSSMNEYWQWSSSIHYL